MIISIICYIGFGIIVAFFVPLLIRHYANTPPKRGKLLMFSYLFAAMTFFAYIILFYICEQNGVEFGDMTQFPIIVPFALFIMPFVPIVLCPYFESKKWDKK